MKKAKRLSERVEKRTKIDEPEWQSPAKSKPAKVASATEDTELGPYLENFVTEIRTLGPLPKTDLTTPESARAAVFVLNEKLEQLERYRKTAEALKSLLLNQDVDGELN